MKRRIIINIDHDQLTDEQAIALVSQVIDGGRVSETAGRKHYCRLSFTESRQTAIYATKRTDSTDTFSIWESK